MLRTLDRRLLPVLAAALRAGVERAGRRRPVGSPGLARLDDRVLGDSRLRWLHHRPQAVMVLTVLVLGGATATAALSGGSTGPAAPATVVRLGPPEGGSVTAYVLTTRTTLIQAASASPQSTTYALVSFTAGEDPAGTAALLPTTVEPVSAYLRAPGGPVRSTGVRVLPADLVDGYRAFAAANPAESSALGNLCACTVGLLVRGSYAEFDRLAAQPGIRAVEVAPPGARADQLRVFPLLPEQS